MPEKPTGSSRGLRRRCCSLQVVAAVKTAAIARLTLSQVWKPTFSRQQCLVRSVWNCYLFISYWWILHVFTIEYKYCIQHYLKHDGCCWPWPQALTASVKWHGSSAASWWSCTPTWIRCIRICWSTLPLIQRRPPWRSYSLISATSEPCSWWVKIAVSRVQSVKVDATSCVPQSFDMRASKWYVWLSHWLPFVSTSSHLCWYGASWKLMISYSAGCYIQARKQNKACSSL